MADAVLGIDVVAPIMERGRKAVDGLALIAAAVLTLLCFLPVWAFVLRGWRIKRDDVMSSLDDASKQMYLARFQNLKTDDPVGEFARIYVFRYGWYRLRLPSFCLALIVFPLSFILSETAISHLLVSSSGRWCAVGAVEHFDYLLAYPSAAAAAIAGAYTWTVAAFISGATRYTLPPATIALGALRLAVAAPLGYAVATLLGPHGRAYAPVIAFGLGAFPLDTIQLLLRRVLNKLGLDLGPADDEGQVTKLDGVDKLIADKMADADISTVSQLAYCDPVQVSMITNIGFDVVTDLQSQALAWIYFGDALTGLRPMGLRGAIEIENLRRELSSDIEATQQDAEATLTAVAAKLRLPEKVVARAFREVGGDPYTEFLTTVWYQSKRKEGALRQERNFWLVAWRIVRVRITRSPGQQAAAG